MAFPGAVAAPPPSPPFSMGPMSPGGAGVGTLAPGGVDPYLLSAVSRPNGFGPERNPDAGVSQLTDLYQQQLAELSACHSLLQTDQERLAEMLAPYAAEDGRLAMSQPDPKVILFKQGLDLRLMEFEDDCRRIQQTERRLQRKIDEATAGFESHFAEISGLADKRIMKRMMEQQRLIEIQQCSLDQLRFERDVLKDETRRLQNIAQRPPENPFKTRERDDDDFYQRIPSLHALQEGRQVPSDPRYRHAATPGTTPVRRPGDNAPGSAATVRQRPAAPRGAADFIS